MVTPSTTPLITNSPWIYLNHLQGRLFVDVLFSNTWIKLYYFKNPNNIDLVYRACNELKERINKPW